MDKDQAKTFLKSFYSLNIYASLFFLFAVFPVFLAQ